MTSSAMPAASEATSARISAEHETSGRRGEGGGEIGAEHVERAVRQIDQVHDAENQRQAGREQKQQHAQLHAVEACSMKYSMVLSWRAGHR